MGIRRPVAMAAAVICLSAAVVGFAEEHVAAEWSPPVEVELSDKDMAEIRTVMIGHAPVLAASPGIKSASAYQDDNGTHADVVFYPHEETGGVAHAVSANCGRVTVDAPWICRSGRLRTYLQIPGQAFHVRVLGNIDYEAAVALIDATRDALQADTGLVGESPDTAVMIYGTAPHGVTVGWGDSDGHFLVSLDAALVDGGDPRSAEDWRVVQMTDQRAIEPPDEATQAKAAGND